MFDNADDYDFNPSSSSKLASLFDNPAVSDDLNSSLTYTAPKQPKSKKELEVIEPVASKPQTSLLLAKVVSLWKLENKEYKTLGKHGLAIIGSQDLNLFEIIVYKEKNKILLRRKISNTCSFHIQKDCFSSFYDNDNHNWLVKFESHNDQNKFCEEIQNYGANIIKNTEQTSQKKEKVSSVSSKETPITKPDVLPKLLQSLDRAAEEVTSDSSGSQKRANILSRMAKMGQQILPNQILKNTSTDISDSELDDSRIERKVPSRKFKRTHTEKSITAKEEAVQQQIYLESQMVPSQSNISNYPPQFSQSMTSPIVYNQPVAYDGLNHYIATQNTELKMNLAQISAKLDSVLSGSNTDGKFEERAYKSKIKALELKSENLQAELQRSEERYYDLQKKYEDLQKENSLIDKEQTEAIIRSLKEEIAKVKLDLQTSEQKNTNYERLEKELEVCKSNIEEHEKTIQTQKLKLKDLEEFYKENKDNENLQSTVDSLNETVATLKLKLKDFEEYYHKTESENQKRMEENNKIMTNFSEKIKENMNDMYQSILGNFDEGSSYSMSDLKAVIAQNLKRATFKNIEDFTLIYKNEGASVLSDSRQK